MDGLKDFAEMLEHLIYEVLGLVVPGAALVIGVAILLGDPSWSTLLTFIEAHPLLSFGAAYVVGYPVQGISRPVTTVFEWLLLLPFRVVGLGIRRLPAGPQAWLLTQLARLKQRLTGRHAHNHQARATEDAVDLVDVSTTYWATRLDLPPGKRLSRGQIQNLSFSVLLPERHRLDRLRAATSLTRGVAVTVVTIFVLLLYQLATGMRSPSLTSTVTLAGTIIAFYGLMERADMYDNLWRAIVSAQFLCTITKDKLSGRPVEQTPK